MGYKKPVTLTGYRADYFYSYNPEELRTLATGATRDSEADKYDYEGFLSPLVLERFARYMNVHRTQSDGSLRDSDNWQKGIPLDAYIKSAFRHFVDLWKLHRGIPAIDIRTGRQITLEDAICALFFNIQGYLHELLKSDIVLPNQSEKTT